MYVHLCGDYTCYIILVLFAIFLGLDFGLAGLRQLQTQPRGLIEILASSMRVWSAAHVLPAEGSIFKTIYDLVRHSGFPVWLT